MLSTKFQFICESGFRGEDLNVIFYQNMSNLHNQYKSAEKKNSQKNPEYMLNYCVRWSRFPTKMAAKLKIEKRGDEILIVHCCFSISQNDLKF
jgi:hypothetical protein